MCQTLGVLDIRCIFNSIMQLPVGLDSGFFLWEYVSSTVLNDTLIVSATMHWLAVFGATGLDPRSWLVFWFCFFSGVSPTDVTPVTLLSSVLMNKIQTLDTEFYNKQNSAKFGQLKLTMVACLWMLGGIPVTALCWLHKLWCSEMQQVTRSHPPPRSVTWKHLEFWDSLLVLTLESWTKGRNKNVYTEKNDMEEENYPCFSVCSPTRVCY